MAKSVKPARKKKAKGASSEKRVIRLGGVKRPQGNQRTGVILALTVAGLSLGIWLISQFSGPSWGPSAVEKSVVASTATAPAPAPPSAAVGAGSRADDGKKRKPTLGEKGDDPVDLSPEERKRIKRAEGRAETREKIRQDDWAKFKKANFRPTQATRARNRPVLGAGGRVSLHDLVVARVEMERDRVTGRVRNRSKQETLTDLQVDIYMLDADKAAVGMVSVEPLLVSAGLFGDKSSPLPPGGDRRFEVKLPEETPDGWSGRIGAVVSRFAFKGKKTSEASEG